MSEHNTQRPDCGYCQNSRVIQLQRFRADFIGEIPCPSCSYKGAPGMPPSETGAVDVDALLERCAGIAQNSFYNLCDSLETQREHCAADLSIELWPLTTRITQLEQENERLNGEAHQSRCNAESSDNWRQEAAQQEKRAEAAEARVNELEAKLAAALKLTTENSIGPLPKPVDEGEKAASDYLLDLNLNDKPITEASHRDFLAGYAAGKRTVKP